MKALRKLTEKRNKGNNFDPKDDAAILNGAMKGSETDDNILVNVFTTRHRKHLQNVKEKYEDMYKINLETVIKQNTSGHFQDTLVNLCYERNTLKCQYLRNATSPEHHKDSLTVVYILCTAEQDELKAMNEVCQKHYGCELHSLLDGFDPDFQHLMKEYLKSEHKSSNDKLDEKKVDEDVNVLLSGEKKTTEGVLVDMLTHRSRRHLRNVVERYERASGQRFIKLVRGDHTTSREFRRAARALTVRKSEYHSRLFFKALRGASIDHQLLIMLMTTLSKRKLMAANIRYMGKHDADLHGVIKSKTSGPYSRLLVGLIPPTPTTSTA